MGIAWTEIAEMLSGLKKKFGKEYFQIDIEWESGIDIWIVINDIAIPAADALTIVNTHYTPRTDVDWDTFVYRKILRVDEWYQKYHLLVDDFMVRWDKKSLEELEGAMKRDGWNVK